MGENVAKGSFKNYNFYVISLVMLSILIYAEFPYIQNSTTTPKWVALLLFSIIAVSLKSIQRITFSKGILVWFLFILNYGIQCFYSYNFWDSLTAAIPMVLAPAVISILSNQSISLDRFYKQISSIIAIVILPLLIYSLYEIVILLFRGTYNHENTYLFDYTFGHRNQYSQFISLLVPVLFLGFKGNRASKILSLISIILIYTVSLLLMNKGVVIVLFGVYPFMFGVYWISSFSKKIKITILSIGLLLVSVFGVVISQSKISNTSFIGKMYTSDYGSGNERIRIWKNSAEIWKQKPILGYGSGDWKIEILDSPLRFTQAEQSEVFYKRAHNDFIQIAVENGLLGLTLLVMFFIIGIYELIKSDLTKTTKFVLVSGVLAFIVVANLSFPLEKIELLCLLFLYLLPGFYKKNNPDINHWSAQKLIFIFSLTGLFLFSSIWLKNEYDYFQNIKNSRVDSIEEMNLDFYSLTPTVLPVYSHLGAHYFQNQDYDKSIEYYSKALIYNPHHVHVLNDLGSSYYAKGDIETAENFYKKALDINPIFTKSLMNYTSLKFNRGDIDGALNMILEVVIEWEPENYKLFISTIAKSKCQWLIDLHDQPDFEVFLREVMSNDELMYEISVNCRKSGACYEDELRIYFSNL